MDMKKEKGTTGNQGIVNDSNEKIEEETDGGYKVTEEKLLKAAEKRDMDEVTKYLDHGADVNYCDKYGTSLHWTAAQGDLHMTRFLLEQGSDMNIKNKWGEGLLHRAIDGNLETLQLLLEQGMDTNMQTEDKTTGLHAALYRGKTDMVQLLLKSGADVNLQDKDLYSPLCAAAKLDDLQVAKLLVDHGACLNCTNYLKFDPLYDVLCNSNVEFAKYLIYEGAIVNESNLRGMVDTNDIPSDDILALCDIFIEAGYRISNNTVGHNGQGKYLNMEEINNHIYHRQQQIVTLRSLCRIRIRNELIQTTNGCSIRTAVCKLPLPKLLKNYIMFEQ
ncbi:putative ankyrin repeat protein RF_0381 isoform X1 [Mytilus edulis]|uniref:putative ankyrin repeat protein RF_0381 isoform X1 n=2 Tax=Mytilus edulis TaxID=6550 RepID=UPI0039EE62BD